LPELKLSQLTSSELEYRLKGDGISIRTGAFTARIQTRVESVAEGLSLLYADYPVVEPDAFADFHVGIVRPRNMRRWFKPQVEFLFDGYSAFKPLPLDQAFPMLEWGVNWCVSNHAHQYLMIHAAVIERGGYAALLPAPPGSGKSTLCAALVNCGWRLLSDELTLVRLSDGKIVPLPRPVSLKNASIDIIKSRTPAAVFSRGVSDTVKGTVAHMKAPPRSIERAFEAVPPRWVVFPKYQPGTPTRHEALPRSRALMTIADNSFNYSLLGERGFEALARLIDSSQCYTFAYSMLDEAIETFDALKAPAPLS
jgi:HprK-related kinase A